MSLRHLHNYVRAICSEVMLVTATNVTYQSRSAGIAKSATFFPQLLCHDERVALPKNAASLYLSLLLLLVLVLLFVAVVIVVVVVVVVVAVMAFI